MVDKAYYLQHQVHAVVSRLCEPIQGLEPAQLAECLGKLSQEENQEGGSWELGGKLIPMVVV